MMRDSLLSLIGGWWGRWVRRPRAEPATEAGERSDVGGRGEVVDLGADGSGPAAHAAGYEKRADDAEGETQAIATAVAKTAPVDAELRARTLEALGNLKQIPALQSLAAAFAQTSARADVAVEDVVASIEKDSALCVRVLAMANSVGVGSEQRVDDLATAVHLLGVVRVRRLAQALFTLRDSQRIAEGIDWRHLWVHAFATAAIAEELEKRLGAGGGSESAIHLSALLHDVGKIVLSTVAPDTYREIMAAAWNGEGRIEALERARLGVTHREAGAIFAEHQRLPAAVRAAIAHHGEPEAADEPWRFEVAVVTLANFLSKTHGLGFSGARLEESDGELVEQSAWRVIVEARGGIAGAGASESERREAVEAIEEELAPFIAGLREELKALRAAE